MASKGERTRQHIIQQAADLFNVCGYAGTSISDVTQRAGIKRGGLYRHFDSKEQIALEAFDYALSLRIEEVRRIVESDANALDRLKAINRTFLGLVETPQVAGGCPILNAAVEADDTFPPLKEKAQKAMQVLHDAIAKVVRDGIQQGDLRPYVSPNVVATVLIAAGEGALMMAKLDDDTVHQHRVIDHLGAYIDSLT